MKTLYLLLIVILSGCSLVDLDEHEENLISKGGHIAIDLYDYNSGYTSFDDLFMKKDSTIVISFSCKINENYFKGVIVDTYDESLMCTPMVAKWKDYNLCLDCVDYCK